MLYIMTITHFHGCEVRVALYWGTPFRSLTVFTYTGWFMTCGHYCRSRFLRSLWSKKLISVWLLFPMVTELWELRNFRQRLPLHRASQVTLHCCLCGAVLGSVRVLHHTDNMSSVLLIVSHHKTAVYITPQTQDNFNFLCCIIIHSYPILF